MSKYDSKLEEELHKGVLSGCEHHPFNLPYTSHHEYEVDFAPKADPHIVIETKGRFRTSQEARKYIDIRRCNPDYHLVFIFEDPNKPMPNAKKRKDGTKYSMAEWAEKNGFEYYGKGNVPKEWSV